MKVGIVTQYGLANYGNLLQKKAVYEVLKSLNAKPCFCNVGINQKAQAKACIKSVINRVFNKEYSSVDRIFLFKKFSQKNITERFFETDNDISGFDYYVFGSDQIWNPEWTNGYYFGEFTESQKKIAFSASFGVSKIPEDKEQDFVNWLDSVKFISVREEAGAEIIKSLTERDAVVLVDPTMMLERAAWDKFTREPKLKPETKYLLTYFLGAVSPEYRRYINELAAEKELMIVDLEDLNKNRYWFSTGPAEFLWLIKNCEVLCTDSFHGSVFSVIFDVPFVVFQRKDSFLSMNSRIDTLLKTLKLESRVFANQSCQEVFEKDYSHTDDILKTEREKAISFLKASMEIK